MSDLLKELIPPDGWSWTEEDSTALQSKMQANGEGSLLRAMWRWTENEKFLMDLGYRDDVLTLRDGVTRSPLTPYPLYRGLAIEGGADAAAELFRPGLSVSMGVSSFTHRKAIAMHFAKLRGKTHPGESTRVIVRLSPGAAALPACRVDQKAWKPVGLLWTPNVNRGKKEGLWLSGGSFEITDATFYEWARHPNGRLEHYPHLWVQIRQCSTGFPQLP